MKKLLVALICSIVLIGTIADAASSGRGGSSSGGGGRSSSSMSSSSRPSTSTSSASPNRGGFSSGTNKPATAAPSAPQSSASPNRGGFNSSTSSKPATAAPTSRSTTTTTTTTNVSRSSSGASYRYNSPYVGGGGMMYGGFGMGFGYTNGLLTGLIIANLMHPTGTTMYTGGGQYNNNALLYPNGQVVNQQGYLVGNYENGQFTPVQNGPMVAQQVPADAGAERVETTGSRSPQQVAQPVIIQKAGPSAGEVAMYILLSIGIVILVIVLISLL